MSRHIMALGFLLSFFVLAGCEPAGSRVPRQLVAEWPEQQLVFVADSRPGRVRAFRMGAVGAPALLAQTSGIGRSSVRDIRLESSRQQLWVLDGHGVYLFEAHGLTLQRHFPLDSHKVSALRVEAGRVLLLDKSGASVAQIDSETLVASWQPGLKRG